MDLPTIRRDTIAVYQDRQRFWRWRYIAHNGHILADSGQGYSRRIDCERAARRVVGKRLDRRVTVKREGCPVSDRAFWRHLRNIALLALLMAFVAWAL